MRWVGTITKNLRKRGGYVFNRTGGLRLKGKEDRNGKGQGEEAEISPRSGKWVLDLYNTLIIDSSLKRGWGDKRIAGRSERGCG